MNNFKIQIYAFILFCGIVMVFMIDSSQERPSANSQITDAEKLFATNPSTPTDPLDSVPSNWLRVEPKSSMRLAEYKVETSSGFYNVIVFKNIGGNEDQNINRWFGQFSGDKIPELEERSESMDIRGSQLTFVQTSGSFNGGMGQSEPTDFAGLMGFIINSNNDVYYFKAVADAKIILEGKRDFVQTVLSMPLF
tara:strand:+ start:430 stop:1011 length:582 start_codon:yes stop_codon:yes gene_type:complete